MECSVLHACAPRGLFAGVEICGRDVSTMAFVVDAAVERPLLSEVRDVLVHGVLARNGHPAIGRGPVWRWLDIARTGRWARVLAVVGMQAASRITARGLSIGGQTPCSWHGAMCKPSGARAGAGCGGLVRWGVATGGRRRGEEKRSGASWVLGGAWGGLGGSRPHPAGGWGQFALAGLYVLT